MSANETPSPVSKNYYGVGLVTPKVYIVGYSGIDYAGLESYLRDTNNLDFLSTLQQAKEEGLSDGECLCSFYAKLCYASLTLEKNKNITRIRNISDNLIGAFSAGHGSVFEHATLNFVVTNCSRVYTHEQVRHRTGVAYSQTSGRYVRTDVLSFVHDPILDSVKAEIIQALCQIKDAYDLITSKLQLDSIADFDRKKKLTSALRRLLPNGQGNEMGMSLNLRTLRHTVQVRTSRYAEWEIREIYNQVYALTKEKFPLLYHGAKEELYEGLLEISGMRMQPYDILPTSSCK